MAKSIRDGFSQLDSALARIAKEPRYLENDRARFDRTPSPIASPKPESGTTTEPDSPVSDTGTQQTGDEEKISEFINTHYVSCPEKQFQDLVNDEKVYLRMSDYRTAWVGEEEMRMASMYDIEYDEKAKETIKQQWIEQGIWRYEWSPRSSKGYSVGAPWEHEIPEWEILVAENHRWVSGHERRKRTLEKIRRDQEASRPLQMFLYQVNQERMRILTRRKAAARNIAETTKVHVENAEREAWKDPENTDLIEELAAAREEAEAAEVEAGAVEAETEAEHIDLNSVAYELVKKSWIRRNIWMEEWTLLPGQKWRHEYAITDFLDGSDREIYLRDQKWESSLLGRKTDGLKLIEANEGQPTPKLIPAKFRRQAEKAPDPVLEVAPFPISE